MANATKTPTICKFTPTKENGFHAVVNHPSIDQPYFIDISNSGQWQVWFYGAEDDVRTIAQGRDSNQEKAKRKALNVLYRHDESLASLLATDMVKSGASASSIPTEESGVFTAFVKLARALSLVYIAAGGLYLLFVHHRRLALLLVVAILFGLLALHFILSVVECVVGRMQKLGKLSSSPKRYAPAPQHYSAEVLPPKKSENMSLVLQQILNKRR